jgi:hypothetical protein
MIPTLSWPLRRQDVFSPSVYLTLFYRTFPPSRNYLSQLLLFRPQETIASQYPAEI